MSPLLWVGTTTYRVTRVSLGSTGATPICVANPERLMLGVTWAGTDALDVLTVWPQGGTEGRGFRRVGGEELWLSLFDFGPIVPAGWFGRVAPASEVDVYEVIRLNRR
jgi:hypothetical protein